MTDTVLFILAAMTGVGKSTLLTNALRYGVPLFGNTYNDLFQITNVPSRYPDDGITVEERILQKTWFSELQIDYFSKTDEIPTSMVLHLELFWINILLSRIYNNPENKEYSYIKSLTERTPLNLINDKHNQAIYSCLFSLPFFRKFDRIIINTLYAPFEVTRNQWNSRESKRNRLARSKNMRFINSNIYNSDSAGDQVYNSIYRSWTNSVSNLAPSGHYFSQMKEGKLILEPFASQLNHLHHFCNLASKDVTFSVIITAYNIQEYIIYAINSVLIQNYHFFELIVVDDGSTDATFDLATKRLENAVNSKVIKQENRGPGGARNTGISAATGDYVVFLDGDDWLMETALSVFKFRAETNPDAIFCNRIWFNEESGKYKSDAVFVKESHGKVAASRGLLRRFAVPAKAFRRDFLIANKIFFPEEMAWEDYPFSYNVLAKAKAINIATEVIYVARKRGGINKSLTQKNRLSEFFLQSRFRQIDMDCNIITNSNLTTTFTGFNFYSIEFETRLMKDIFYLTKDIDADTKQHAMKRFANYIRNNKEIIFSAISNSVKNIYQAILNEDLESAITLINIYGKKKFPTDTRIN